MKRLIPVLVLFTTFGLIAAPSRAQEELTNQDCLDCHSDEELTKEGSHGEVISLFVDGEVFGQTIHGDFSCTDCHASIAEIPHDDDLPKVDCSDCHPGVVEEYTASIHGIANGIGNGDAPTCTELSRRHSRADFVRRAELAAISDASSGDLRPVSFQSGSGREIRTPCRASYRSV